MKKRKPDTHPAPKAADTDLIAETGAAVAATVNTGLTLLCRRIGKRMDVEILKNKRADYGSEIVSKLSQELSWPHHLAEYLTAFPSRDILREKRHAAIEALRKRLDNREGA